ncbi:MAG TPA: alpha/beta hydrolase [Acidimicrobiia bacterium]|nr:alpha/beta hydrolase [Acidimicrobiia bacterium]
MVRSADGSLAPRSGLAVVRFAPGAAGDVVRVASELGDVVVRHPSATGARGAVAGDTVVYPGGLSGGRDLVERVLPGGFEESVVVPSAAAGGSYDVVFVLPAGMSAANGAEGVEFLDARGVVVATFGGGVAWDSVGVRAPVSVTVAGVVGAEVTVRVAVASSWLGDAARVFPVTIDPLYHAEYIAVGGADAYVSSAVPGGAYWSSTDLLIGKHGSAVTRAEMKFDIGDKEYNPHIRVIDSRLRVFNHWSATCSTSTSTQVDLLAFSGWKGGALSWNDQSPLLGAPLVDQANFAKGFSGSCPGDWADLDTTSILSRWATTGSQHVANNGLGLRAYNEGSTASAKKFFSGNTFAGPILEMTYDYYDAEYGPARSWEREANKPLRFGIWVRNDSDTPWTPSGDYKLVARTWVGSSPFERARVAPTEQVDNGEWHLFEVDLGVLGHGAYALEFDMVHETTPDDTPFKWYGNPARMDALVVTPAGSLGTSPYVDHVGGVNTFNGNYHFEATDITVPGVGPELALTRSYNSRDTDTGWFGRGWSSTYETKIVGDFYGLGVSLVHPDGRKEFFAKHPTNPGEYLPSPGYSSSLVSYGGGYVLVDGSNSVFAFDGFGRLLHITDDRGITTEVHWNTAGKVYEVVNTTTDRRLEFVWNGDRVTTARARGTDNAPYMEWKYYYDTTNTYLKEACDPRDSRENALGGSCTLFAYTDAKMYRIRRERGNLAVELSYFTSGTYADHVATRLDGEGNQWSYAYTSAGSGSAIEYRATITLPLISGEVGASLLMHSYNLDGQIKWTRDPYYVVTKYGYDTDPDDGDPEWDLDYDRGFLEDIEVTGTNSNGQQETRITRFVTDERGNVTKKIDPAGNTEYFTYNTKNQLRFARDARSSSESDDTYKTSYWYDADTGNKLLETAPAVTIGVWSGTPPALSTTTAEPTKSWIYTDGTEPAYGAGTTPAGLLERETDANGNQTNYRYDETGILREITAPSGLVTTIAIDTLGRELRRRDTCNPTPECDKPDVLTEQDYDDLGLVEWVKAPRVDDLSGAAVSWHQRLTTNTYDGNGNIATVTVEDVNSAGDAERVTSYAYDDNDREISVTDPEGGILTRVHDARGNVELVTDQQGRQIRSAYDRRDQLKSTHLKNYVADPYAGSAPITEITLNETSYTDFGEKQSETLWTGSEEPNELGVRRDFEYYPGGRLHEVWLRAYDQHPDDGGGTRDILLESYVYNARGDVITEKRGSDLFAKTSTYDNAGRLVATAEDPSGTNRVTTLLLDAHGNTLRSITTRNGSATTPETRHRYDTSHRPIETTVENGSFDVTTWFGYDQRGNLVRTVNPRGSGPTDAAYTTTNTYDAADRIARVTSPAVSAWVTDPSDGSIDETTNVSAQTTTGYDTFGNPIRSVDANGNATTSTYDKLDRQLTITHPQYTPITGGAALTPTESFQYDDVGNLRFQTNRRGYTTEYRYDQLNRVYLQIDPQLAGAPAAGTTITYYDLVNQVAQVDPNGVRSEWEYDDLNRVRVERRKMRTGPVPQYESTFDYDDLGNRDYEKTPNGAVTTHTYSPLGERLSTTAPPVAGAGTQTTTWSYDAAGNVVRESPPLGPDTLNVWTVGGRLRDVETRDPLNPTITPGTNPDTLLATTSYQWDRAGNKTSVTTPNGQATTAKTTYAYDALNRLTQLTQPVSANTADDIVTQYGYDRNGNHTRLVDGRGNATGMDYSTWNQLELTVEPPAGGDPNLAARSYKTGYNAAGLPVLDQISLITSIARTYDELGRLTQESGTTQANVHAAATRTFGYDLGGRRTRIGHPAGDVQIAYDDRSLPTNVIGGAGTTAYQYDADGQLTVRTDAAGTASFAWTARHELDTAVDPLTGTTANHDWDANSRITEVRYGTGSTPAKRTFTYDTLGRRATVTLTNTSNATTRSESYAYDLNGNVTSETVGPPGSGGAGTFTYGYDRADRLTSQTVGATTTSYAYDKNGNRTSAGTTSYTYDGRNRLTNAGSATYGWSTNDALVNRNGTMTTVDAFGRPIAHAGATYSYDSLDRIATRNSAAFSYNGLGIDPVNDGTHKISQLPDGTPLGHKKSSTSSVVVTDQHGDVTALAQTSGVLRSSFGYDPFGTRNSTVGTMIPNIGYQADYTDTASGDVWMGARWYIPGLDTFSARDTYPGTLDTPVSLNRYTYAHNNPLRYIDPDGHLSVDAAYEWAQSGRLTDEELYFDVGQQHATQEGFAVSQAWVPPAYSGEVTAAVPDTTPAAFLALDAAARAAMRVELASLRRTVEGKCPMDRLGPIMCGMLDEAKHAMQLEEWLDSDGLFLLFTTKHGGRVIRVHGDLATADHVAVVIPGAGTNLWNFDAGTGARAEQLLGSMQEQGPASSVAVIAWLGYDAPDNLFQAGTGGYADKGADHLTRLVGQVRAVNASASMTLVGHSYGSLVAGIATKEGADSDVDRLVLVGSPGAGVSTASELGAVDVWVGEAPGDWVADTAWHGSDPSSWTGHQFDVNTRNKKQVSGHNDYFLEGSFSLLNITRISLGLPPLGGDS